MMAKNFSQIETNDRNKRTLVFSGGQVFVDISKETAYIGEAVLSFSEISDLAIFCKSEQLGAEIKETEARMRKKMDKKIPKIEEKLDNALNGMWSKGKALFKGLSGELEDKVNEDRDDIRLEKKAESLGYSIAHGVGDIPHDFFLNHKVKISLKRGGWAAEDITIRGVYSPRYYSDLETALVKEHKNMVE